MSIHSATTPVPPVVDFTVQRAKRGDLDSFRELYQRHAGRVHALSLRMSGNTALAEDLTQEVFVKAWRKMDSFRGDAAFSTWLHRLAVNTILDALKRERRHIEPEAPVPPPTRPRTGRVDLERAVATLPTKARQVFVLHDLEGYTHVEIADFMEITPGTARGQLHRARRLLREALQ